MTRDEINERCLSTDHLQSQIGWRSAKGGVLAVATQLVRIAMHLVGLAILARLLEPEDFGLVAMASTAIAFVAMFSDLGLSAATIQRSRLRQQTVSALFFVGLGVSVLLASMLVLAAPLISAFYQDPRVGPLVIGLALSVPLAGATAQHAAILTRGMRWVPINLIALISQLAGIVVAVALAWLTDLSYWALVAQALVSAFVALVATWVVCPWRPSLALSWRSARSEIWLGVNLSGFNLINYFNRQLDNVLIGRRWGASELGFYSRAYTLMLLPLTLVNSPVGSAIRPLLSRCQDEPDVWRDYLLRGLAWISFVGYGVACLLLVTSESLIQVVLGPGWERSVVIFSLLAISLFGATPMNAMGWIYLSLGRTGRMLQWGLIGSIVIVSSFVIGLPNGAPGVALCYSIAICLLAVPTLAFAVRDTPVRLSQLLRVLVAPAMAAAGTLALALQASRMLHEMHPILALFVGGMVTAGLYCTFTLLLIRFDPAQRPQRDALAHIRERSLGRFKARLR